MKPIGDETNRVWDMIGNFQIRYMRVCEMIRDFQIRYMRVCEMIRDFQIRYMRVCEMIRDFQIRYPCRRAAFDPSPAFQRRERPSRSAVAERRLSGGLY